jgi:phenazine biosynthesis protein phzE
MQPFALLHRDGADHVDVLTGDVVTVGTLADIPLTPGPPGPQTLALVPYRQITERGFACVDDGAPLECLRIATRTTRPLAELIAELPETPVALRDGAFDLTDEAYGEIVEAVLRDEIGHGEGANFVIHRVFTATVDGDPLAAARSASSCSPGNRAPTGRSWSTPAPVRWSAPPRSGTSAWPTGSP